MLLMHKSAYLKIRNMLEICQLCRIVECGPSWLWCNMAAVTILSPCMSTHKNAPVP